MMVRRHFLAMLGLSPVAGPAVAKTVANEIDMIYPEVDAPFFAGCAKEPGNQREQSIGSISDLFYDKFRALSEEDDYERVLRSPYSYYRSAKIDSKKSWSEVFKEHCCGKEEEKYLRRKNAERRAREAFKDSLLNQVASGVVGKDTAVRMIEAYKWINK